MPITCQICQKEFNKQITNSHLKTHSITTQSYKVTYGKNSLSCPEYRNMIAHSRTGSNNPNFGNRMPEASKEIIRESKKGKIPWNKNLKFKDTTIQQNAVAKREEKYANGILTRPSIIHSIETKEKISTSVKNYAASNQEELSTRAYKAIQTKLIQGVDLAFFKNHIHTEESKRLIAESSRQNGENKSKLAESNRQTLINLAKLEITETTGNSHLLRCQVCNNTFSLTKQYFTESKFRENLCTHCYPRLSNRSNKEKALFDFVQSMCPDAIPNYKFSNNTKHEIDIFIPSANLGIEFNGLYWHSEQVLKDKLSDTKKHRMITDDGIRCIVIMEDEWDFKEDIVKTRLQHILGKSDKRVFARNCSVQEIDSKLASSFCKKYHIQSTGRSNIRFGLFFNNELISVMTFSKSNLSRKITEWELNRFCSIPGVSIVGGASKLLRAFELKYKPSTLVTYADRRWSEGKVYETIGFDFIAVTNPGYWYFLPNEGIRIHRFSLRKNKDDDQSLTELENRMRQGYLRIWDCGHKKYIKTYP